MKISCLFILLFFSIINCSFFMSAMGSFDTWLQLENSYEHINKLLPQKYSKKTIITPGQIEQYLDLREQLLTLKNAAQATNTQQIILKASKKIELIEKMLENYHKMDVD